MPETAYEPRPKETSLAERPPSVDDDTPVSNSDELLSTLSDEYARNILRTIGNGSLPAREIATRLDISRPTVYRRLNRLEDLGVVETSMEVDPDGHHRKQFRVVIERLTLSFGDGGLRIARPQ